MHSPTPWNIEVADGKPRIVDCNGRSAISLLGVSDDDRERIVACVNACAVCPTESLKRYSDSMIPLRFNCPDGNTLAQARAWQSIWKALWNAGMSSFVPNPLMVSGVDRAIQFINHLTKRE